MPWVENEGGAGSAVFLNPIVFGANVASPGVSQAQSTTGNGQNLTIASQAPLNSGTDVPGNIILNTPAPISTGAPGLVAIQSGGTSYVQMGQYANGSVNGAVWLGNVTASPGDYTLVGNTTTTALNGPAGGQVFFQIGGSTVSSVSTSAFAFVMPTLEFTSGVSTPLFTQVAQPSTGAGSGAAGYALNLVAQAGQAATGAANNGGNGGNLVLSSGAGGTSGSATAGKPGAVLIEVGGNTVATFGGAGWQAASTSIALTTGTVTLSAAQAGFPYLLFTGSLTGNVVVVLPPTTGGAWTVDATAVTLNGHTITLQANSNNWATTIGVTNIYEVQYGGSGKLYGTTLTP